MGHLTQAQPPVREQHDPLSRFAVDRHPGSPLGGNRPRAVRQRRIRDKTFSPTNVGPRTQPKFEAWQPQGPAPFLF
jgi:hypothetical protein